MKLNKIKILLCLIAGISWFSAASAQISNFKVVIFYSKAGERDHLEFAYKAIRFFRELAAKKQFTLDTTSNWKDLNPGFLQNYRLVLWLNDSPQNPAQRGAFESYMDHGGAWLGFHVSAYNDQDSHWPWFVNFLGGAVFYNNNWPPLPATMIVEGGGHPVTRQMPAKYQAPINEWYGWKPNPRDNKDVKVLVTLATANYPLGKKDIITSGDIPVVWTNTKYKMIYMNMGHGDENFDSLLQNKMFENALLWLATGK
jgi:type 1 glutamine amidotransferase